MSLAQHTLDERVAGLVPAGAAVLMLGLFATAIALVATVYLGAVDPQGIAAFRLPPIAAVLMILAAVALVFAALFVLVAVVSQ